MWTPQLAGTAGSVRAWTAGPARQQSRESRNSDSRGSGDSRDGDRDSRDDASEAAGPTRAGALERASPAATVSSILSGHPRRYD